MKNQKKGRGFHMDRRYLSPLELLGIATQHAYTADYMLQQIANGMYRGGETIAVFSPITSLMYVAFQLTFKAYCLHDHRPIKEYKNLMELVELNSHLGLSSNDIFLLKTLSRQQVFNKGVDYDLWENQQQLHVFCEEIISLYERVQSMMPLELQSDYQE
ncbi:TPA: hypothetical protein JBG74_03540 [Legionella pneumophila]|uniref:HEPN domain-containing protein n=6 Tax=Legionella pneumophila TaxID=446 RepID=Q5ZRM1_LEGPH|nr:hypothetical protein lpg2860 [Legionella pneumophila subsp. pneumophila str. Philadelphia 1]AEW53082.1 hypothetical protein lp12_2849 [Legionella pneumophila subsp. pneumophila ATCC 43290]PNL76802.1 hypothetical protein A6J41_002355 [Legionella pneumophila subsp. pneumophila]PPK26173.1 hypothetical protein C3929_15010 [Legionella pneumophila]HAT8683331.1 hypothetical protein [Legionella pneumophila subsp. pneumophila ATCC 43283]